MQSQALGQRRWPAIFSDNVTGAIERVVPVTGSLSPARVFAVLAACFGIAFIVVTPPFEAADESVHFKRAFLVSEGWLAPIGRSEGYGAWIPRGIFELHRPMKPGRPHKHDAKELLGALHANPDSWDRRFFTVRRHMNVYSPVLYAPAAVGIMLGRQLDLSFAACLYQARLANLLTWIGLTALALRSFPVRGWTVALISLVPMAVYRASVVSADAVTTGFSILSIAAILRSAFVRKGTVTHWETAALVGSTLLLGQGKPGYAPIALLALLIPAGRFRRRGHRVSLILAMALAVSLPSLTWMAFVNAADSKPPMGVWALADPARQFAAIAGAPLAYLGTVAATLRSEAGLHAWGFVGYFAALQVRLPMAWCVFWAVALFALAAVDADRSPSRTPAQSALFVAAFAVSVLVILTGQYIFFNPVGERLIAGFQGRYYIPLAPLLVCALPGAGRVTAVSSRNRAVFVAGVSTLTLGASVFEIWRALF